MEKEKMAFISRHTPTPEQVKVAADLGYDLVHVGDRDAFSVTVDGLRAEIAHLGYFTAAAIVHPAAAMRLAWSFKVGVFKNENRAPEGQKPEFHCSGLVVWDWRN